MVVGEGGSAEVALSFNWGDDMVAATNATQGALATILPDLPAGTRLAIGEAVTVLILRGLWIAGQLCQSAPSWATPRKNIAPGTCSST